MSEHVDTYRARKAAKPAEDPRYTVSHKTDGTPVYVPRSAADAPGVSQEPPDALSGPTGRQEAPEGDFKRWLRQDDEAYPVEPQDAVTPEQPDIGDLIVPPELAERLSQAIGDNQYMRQRAGLDPIDPSALRDFAADGGLEGLERFAAEAEGQTARLQAQSAFPEEAAAAYQAIQSFNPGAGGSGGSGGFSDMDRALRAVAQADSQAASLSRAGNLSREDAVQAWVDALRQADPSAVQ
jgi:hypothetical protein